MKKNLIYLGMAATLLFAVVKESSAQTDWHITGNAGTTTSNFIGTTDNVDLRFRAGTATGIKMIIKTNNRVGIGVTSPAGKLHVQG